MNKEELKTAMVEAIIRHYDYCTPKTEEEQNIAIQLFEKQAISEYEYINQLVTAEEANKMIQQAIAEREASLWKKYPENKPEKQGFYLVSYNRAISKHSFRLVSKEARNGDEWISLNKFSNVIAFRELPAPYQEGGEG